MTEPPNSNSSMSSGTPRKGTLAFRAASPTYLLWILGGGFIVAGIEYPTDWRLIVSGGGLLFLAFVFDKFTAFGEDGPLTLKEDATFEPDGRIQKLRYSTGLFNPANFLRFVGTLLTAWGVLWRLNWALIVTGFVVAGAGLYLKGQTGARR